MAKAKLTHSQKLTESQLQLALTLVKQSTTARDARRKASRFNRADLAGDPHLRDNRRALGALLTPYVVKSGLDLERFEQINAKNRGDLRRIGEARKAAAVKESPSTMEVLRQGVASRRKALEFLASPNVVVLEAPVMITFASPGFPPVVLDSSNIENWNSTAKFKFQFSSPFNELTFLYAWVNSNETSALINAAGMLAVNGFCFISSNGSGIDPNGGGQSGLWIDADLSVMGSGVVVPRWQPLESQSVVDWWLDTIGWFTGDETESQKVFDGYFLQLSQVIVPPGETVLIGTTLTVEATASDGVIDVDFSSGDFNVLSSFAAVTILHRRPIR